MQLQPRSNSPRDLEALDPVDRSTVQGERSFFRSFRQDESPILHYLQLFRKRGWWILATLAIVFTLSVVVTLRATRLYQATSKIAVSPENPNLLGFKDFYDNSPDYDYDAALETQVAILRSEALATQVIDTMHLDRDPRFTGVKASSSGSDDVIHTSEMEPDPGKAAGLLGAFEGGLNVQLIPGSRLISVSYTHPDPQLAAEIVNTLVRGFIEQNFKTKYESVTQTSDWLTKELADLQLRVQTSEEKLVRYQKDHSILGIDDKENIVTSKLDELNKQLTAAEADRIQKESNYRLATEGDPTAFTRVANGETSTLMDKLREREADLNTQYAQLTTQFGSAYPKVAEVSNQLKQVHSEIAAEKTRILGRLQDEYLAALEQEKMLRAAFDEQKRQANQLNESSIEYSILKRDADSNRQLYESLQQRLKEAGVSAGLKSSNIRVVDVARIPTSPIAPNVPRNLMLGFLMGLGGGIGLAFVLESMDRTVRTSEELSTISTLPVLGVIPLEVASNGHLRKQLTAISRGNGKSGSPGLVAYARPKSEAAEAYRALRTSILLSANGTAPKVILVTSSLPQEGKTTICANEALVLAQRGSRVLLVDADLRRPGLAELLEVRPSRGLSTLISGLDKFEDVVVPHGKVDNLWVLHAGPIPPQPSELLGSSAMMSYITAWRDVFDHVIIDTPPCLSVTDAMVLSPAVDHVILVARSGQTLKPALRRACSLLSQVNANVMGVVLNAVDTRADTYYHYSHSYGGRYYDEVFSSNGKSANDGSAPESRVS
jgi:polysaccharide biosynthesis transport protein